jgi:uncharacterized protein involved in exopolysaccharide biosynthesis
MDPTHISQEQQNLHFLDYWRVVRSRKEIILAVTLLVTLAGAFVTSLLEKRYQATARMKIHQDSTNLQVFNPTMPMQQYNPYFLLTEMEVLNSALILGDVVDKANLASSWGRKFTKGQADLSREQAVDFLKKRVRFQQQRNTSNIDITVVADTPEEAAYLANQIAKSYDQHRLNSNREQIRKGLAMLQEQLVEVNREVEAAEDNLEKVREQLGLATFNFGVRITAETERLRQLQADLMSYRVDMLTRKARMDELVANLLKAFDVSIDEPDVPTRWATDVRTSGIALLGHADYPRAVDE